jgi:hypothetical protein
LEQGLLHPILCGPSGLPRAAVRPTHAHVIEIGANERLYRFSEIESVTALALMVLHYRIEVLEEPEFVHETFEQRKERVLKEGFSGLTVRPERVPLQFIKRK